MKIKYHIFQIAGAILIILSLGLFGFLQLNTIYSQKHSESVATQISQLLPQKTEGIIDEYSNSEMPILQFEENDYVCLLNIPDYNVNLPVQNEWEPRKLIRNPCRFFGSSYNNNLILGGSNQNGQFDFCSQLDIGDRVFITDMQGVEFAYKVEYIERSKKSEFEKLYDDNYGLTLFVQETFSLDYIIVRCNLPY